MLSEDNDFNIHMGDTMYPDSEVPEPGPLALSRAQKWAKYRLNLGEPNLTNLRRSAGFYSHWDDHEFINDFSPNQTSSRLRLAEPITLDREELYKAGQQAFRDYAPVTYSKQVRHLPHVPVGKEPRAVLPRRALVPQRQGLGRRDLRQPGDRLARPCPDGAPEHSGILFGARPIAR